MKYQWLPFAELSPKEVYDILQVRENVFHLEHGALWRDIDDLDLQSKHLLGYENGNLIAYLRVYLKDKGVFTLIAGRLTSISPSETGSYDD